MNSKTAGQKLLFPIAASLFLSSIGCMGDASASRGEVVLSHEQREEEASSSSSTARHNTKRSSTQETNSFHEVGYIVSSLRGKNVQYKEYHEKFEQLSNDLNQLQVRKHELLQKTAQLIDPERFMSDCYLSGQDPKSRTYWEWEDSFEDHHLAMNALDKKIAQKVDRLYALFPLINDLRRETFLSCTYLWELITSHTNTFDVDLDDSFYHQKERVLDKEIDQIRARMRHLQLEKEEIAKSSVTSVELVEKTEEIKKKNFAIGYADEKLNEKLAEQEAISFFLDNKKDIARVTSKPDPKASSAQDLKTDGTKTQKNDAPHKPINIGPEVAATPSTTMATEPKQASLQRLEQLRTVNARLDSPTRDRPSQKGRRIPTKGNRNPAATIEVKKETPVATAPKNTPEAVPATETPCRRPTGGMSMLGQGGMAELQNKLQRKG